jgi:5-formyltetrahydrofolate cyclo-ligase
MPSGEIQTDEIVRHALSAGKDVFVPYLHPYVLEKAQTGEGGGEAPRKVMDMVRLRGVEDYEGLKRDSWGIPTVTKEGVEGRERILDESGNANRRESMTRLDLMLIPGVAFEAEGDGTGSLKRLGHGKGFYDYFLHRYRSFEEPGTEKVLPKMVVFGLALEEQLLRDGQELHVPTGPHDSLLDGLIVGNTQIIEAAPR